LNVLVRVLSGRTVITSLSDIWRTGSMIPMLESMVKTITTTTTIPAPRVLMTT
jgi:hypothetical protein